MICSVLILSFAMVTVAMAADYPVYLPAIIREN
jgi:hypothetical protein